jgi:NagD protein
VPFLALTNNSLYSPAQVSTKLAAVGLKILGTSIWTCAQAASYSSVAVTHACGLIAAGARFIATNPDRSVPTSAGSRPACGAVAALITAAAGVNPYFVGKPNPTMMRTGLDLIGGDPRTTVMVGDRMDTDIVGGVEAGLRTILVLSGCTRRADEVRQFPFQPDVIVNSVADLVELIWR